MQRSNPASTPATRSTFGDVPAMWICAFLAGVGGIFAPIGILLASGITPERPMWALLVIGAASAALAICWAGAFVLSRWFVVGIVLFSLLLAAFSTPGIALRLGMPSGQPTATALTLVVSLVAGYILFVLFISVQGRRSIELQNEMRLARQIHDALVPDIDRKFDRFEIFGVSSPSSAMGGDLIDLVERDDRLDVCLADVSGHGVRAGVVMGMLKSVSRHALRHGASAAGVVAETSRTLAEVTPSDVFATLAWMRCDEASSTVQVCLAGHHPVLHIRRGAVTRIENDHLPVGITPDETYGASTIELEAGDVLAVYTDGLTETADDAGQLLGAERLDALIASLADASLEQIAGQSIALARDHGPQTDDQSVLLIRAR